MMLWLNLDIFGIDERGVRIRRYYLLTQSLSPPAEADKAAWYAVYNLVEGIYAT